MLNDPYAELGVARSASLADIRQAYRKLAKALHPDARPDDSRAEERFKRVTAAFHILNDPTRRKKFDRGEIDADGNEQSRRPANGFKRRNGHKSSDGGFSDIFGGGDERGRRSVRGEDVRYRLAVDFLEAANGGRKRVVMGDGKALDLVVPEGVRPGQVLRLKGQGRGGDNGAAPGDALVEIDVLEHPYFERKGDDVHVDLPITLKEAVLGGKVRAPTLTGPVTVTVPKNSNSGTSLRLRGKGVKGERGRGDQYVRLLVMLPERPDPDLSKLVADWEPRNAYDPRRKLGD